MSKTPSGAPPPKESPPAGAIFACLEHAANLAEDQLPPITEVMAGVGKTPQEG